MTITEIRDKILHDDTFVLSGVKKNKTFTV
jgi:hypothetical protein